MKTLLFSLLALLASALRAAEDPVIATLRAADDERVSATQAGDRKRLEEIYASDLHYAHSSGKVDNLAAHLDLLATRKTVYEKYEYVQREFRLQGPGVAIMLGRVIIHSNRNGVRQSNDVNFLGVWRLEQGKWRFAAWQACKNPSADGKK